MKLFRDFRMKLRFSSLQPQRLDSIRTRLKNNGKEVRRVRKEAKQKTVASRLRTPCRWHLQLGKSNYPVVEGFNGTGILYIWFRVTLHHTHDLFSPGIRRSAVMSFVKKKEKKKKES